MAKEPKDRVDELLGSLVGGIGIDAIENRSRHWFRGSGCRIVDCFAGALLFPPLG